MAEPKFFEPYWTWASKDTDVCVAYMRMDGRISIADLLTHLAEVAPGLPPEELMLNCATVKWERPATADELAERAAWAAKAQARHEAWERRMVVELSAKYGLIPDPDAVDPTPTEQES